jgi:hypothetical protein
MSLQLLQLAPAVSEHVRPCAEGPQKQQRHRLRFGDGQLGERAQSCPQALLLGSLALVGREDRTRRRAGHLIVGSDQQLLLVPVEAVEGRPRDAGQSRQVDDAHRLVALLLDELDQCGLQAFALVMLDRFRCQSVGSRRQAPIPVRWRRL